MAAEGGSTGRGGFVARHGLYTDEQARLAAEVAARIERDGLEVVRLSFADQHGVLRGEPLALHAALSGGEAEARVRRRHSGE